MNVQQSIWNVNTKGESILTFDHQLQYKNKITLNSLSTTQEPLNQLFEKGKKTILKLGALVMSPKGIGRLVKLDKENNIAVIKIMKHNEKEYEFKESEISAEFPIYLKFSNVEYDHWIRIIVSANEKVEIIFKILEAHSNKSQDDDFIIVFNGEMFIGFIGNGLCHGR